MTRYGFTIFVLVVCMVTVACTPVEQQAYRTIVASNAFIKSVYTAHPECKTNPPAQSTVCVALGQAVAAKDTLIDATEVYCGGPSFDNGGACQPPQKGTPAYTTAVQKMQSAISQVTQIENDVRKAIGVTSVSDGSDPLPACRPPLKPPACTPPPPLDASVPACTGTVKECGPNTAKCCPNGFWQCCANPPSSIATLMTK